MDKNALLSRIESTSESLLLADPSDIDVLARIHGEFSEFALWADEEGSEAPARALRAACGRIEQIILREASDPAAFVESITKCLAAFQTLVRDGRSVEEANFPPDLIAGANSAADAGSEGPSSPDVTTDRGLLAEFLGHAQSVLSEIEPLIVAVEGNPSSKLVSQVRREIHTLKAEAAFVGLNQVSAILHATEDAIESASPETMPDGVLDVVDWVQRYIAAREGKSGDPGSPDSIIARLAGVKVPGPRADAVEPKQAGKPLEADPDLLREFVAEAREHLDNADVHLLIVETNPADADALNAVFRAFHTIKGVAGFLALEEVQALAHESENLLDKARKGELELKGNYIDVTFDAVDMMKRLIANAERALSSGGVLDSEDGLGELVERLKLIVGGKLLPHEGASIQLSGPRKRIGEILEDEGATTEAAVQAALSKQSIAEALPLGELLVREVVISRSQLNQALAIQENEGFQRKLGEILVASGMARLDDINRAINKQNSPVAEPLGATLVRAGDVSAKQVAQALRSQRQQQTPIDVKEAIKVDAERLDKLIDLIGEMVITESMVSQSNELTKDASPQLVRQIGQLGKITRELQEIGLSLRMVPVRGTFQKMSRLVRDLAKKSGKAVEFVTEGEDTELDKTVVDRIGDPLVHMVRNAVDHGLEATSADRIGAGKSESGRVTLRAFHKSGSIFVEIEDDGRGLDRDAILAKGKERGLVRDGDALSDREIFGLIFEAGFSTAKQITDVSGRGVGMDVVRRNIESLRGQVDIQSKPGKGTTFSIRLPLTLAIIDGMVIRVGKERYIVPTLSVLRSIKPVSSQLATVVNRGEMLSLQGRMLPLFRLHKLFEVADAQSNPLDAIVLILEDEGRQVGLMVDELLGQQQIVIKSLGEAMKGAQGVAGGAIMGDGSVGLIIDVGGVVRLAQEASCAPLAHPIKPAA
jgi:two-component system chemotaxis sensor kinase CheA